MDELDLEEFLAELADPSLIRTRWADIVADPSYVPTDPDAIADEMSWQELVRHLDRRAPRQMRAGDVAAQWARDRAKREESYRRANAWAEKAAEQ